MPRIIIKKLATFSYQDSSKVLWNYECNTTVPGMETTKDQDVSTNPEHVKGRAIIVEQEGKIAKLVLSINEPENELYQEKGWGDIFKGGLRGVIHAERKMSVKESIEEMLGNLHINAVHEHENEERSWLDIRPYEPGSVLDNWTAEEIPKVFRTVLE
ncbi:hypothetical protein GOBAR_DD09110 [Gossypium barbadense]|nr:hypothetical protein GOBAR_DD09110 [Gossypium barbadense]